MEARIDEPDKAIQSANRPRPSFEPAQSVTLALDIGVPLASFCDCEVGRKKLSGILVVKRVRRVLPEKAENL